MANSGGGKKGKGKSGAETSSAPSQNKSAEDAAQNQSEKNQPEKNQNEQKKDLTGILELSKSLAESGQAPPVPEGAITEETPIEKIEEFESLEDYADHNPLPPGLQDSPALGDTPAPEDNHGLQDLPGIPGLDSFHAGSDAETTGDGVSENASPTGPDLGDLNPLGTPLDTPVPSASEPSSSFNPLGTPLGTPSPSPTTDSPNTEPLADNLDFGLDHAPMEADAPHPPGLEFMDHSHHEQPPHEPALDFSAPATPPLPTPAPQSKPKTQAQPPASAGGGSSSSSQAPRAPKPPQQGISVAAKSPVAAAVPFSVLILGALKPEEKEKLLDVLSRENMGIREIDLEPQFESGKILIPRISEYAAVLLVQSLRAVQAEIRMGPSDTIFATADTRAEDAEAGVSEAEKRAYIAVSDDTHPAEKVQVTTANAVLGFSEFLPVDTVTASAVLSSKAVEVENTTDYLDMIESLKRELKYKAYYKGANAILNLTIHLQGLSSPTHYRLTLTGSAMLLSSSEISSRANPAIPSDLSP